MPFISVLTAWPESHLSPVSAGRFLPPVISPPSQPFSLCYQGEFPETIGPPVPLLSGPAVSLLPGEEMHHPDSIHLLVTSAGVSHPPSPTFLPLWTCYHSSDAPDPIMALCLEERSQRRRSTESYKRGRWQREGTQELMRDEQVEGREGS